MGRWIFGIILGLISLSFVFWGIDFNMAGPGYAAKVNGDEISLQEFERELQIEQSRFQDMYRLDLTEDVRRMLRGTVLDRLVRQAALLDHVDDRGYRVSNERLFEYVTSVPAFQVNGQFSVAAYESQIAIQGLTQTGFEERTRAQLELLDLQTGVFDTAFLAPYEFDRYIELANQRREVGYAVFEVEAFIDQVEVTEDEVAEHYEANTGRYMTEEAVELEYIELRRTDVAESIEVTDAQLRDYYERVAGRFRVEEERSASHILIVPGPDESEDEARARVEALAERIRSGEDFDALAAEYSEDPGSAENGGNLGWIARGSLSGPFEDALYALEQGEVSDPVRTDFGFHLIRFDDVREGREESFEDVRDELLVEYRETLADDRFYELAEQLGDSAFDAYDSLDPVARDTGLPLQRIERFPRTGDSEAFPNSAPVVDAVFGLDAAAAGENSEVLELADGHIAVVRAAHHYEPEQLPLEAVADEIHAQLTRERAQALAEQAAEAFASAWPADVDYAFLAGEAEAPAEGEEGADAGDSGAGANSGAGADSGDGSDDASNGAATAEATPSSPAARLAAEHGGRWVGPVWLMRTNAETPTELLARVFNTSLPGEDGISDLHHVAMSNGDQALFVLSDVEAGVQGRMTAAERTSIQQQLLQRVGEAELGAYVEAITGEARVTIPPEVLEPSF